MIQTRVKRPYPSIVNAPHWRRISAYFIDLLLILIVGLISFYTLDNIYSNSRRGLATNEALYEARINSGLYTSSGNLVAKLLGEDITSENYEALYLNRLDFFYNDATSGFTYENSSYYTTDAPFNYRTMVLLEGSETSLFVFDVTFELVDYRFKDSLSNEDKQNAWTTLYNIALNNLAKSPAYASADRATRTFVSLNLTISAFIGTIFPWLIFPLFFGHGRSVGKFFNRLAVVNKDGFKVSNTQVVIRFFVFGIFETALNIYAFFIPLLLTSGVLALTKKNQAIHDLISKTYVIDAKMSRVFNNSADEKAFYESSASEKANNKTFFTEAPLPGNLPLAK